MPTVEQLQSALINAHKAGDTVAAKKLADAITQLMQAKSKEPDDVTVGESARDVARALAQGVSFGTAEELEAAARSLVGPETYEEEVSKIRGEIGAFRERNPLAAYGLEIAGSIPSGLGVARAVSTGLTKAPKIASLLAEGAVTGGLYGAGSTAGGVEERLKGAAIGGLLGGAGTAAIGTALPKVSAAAQRLIDEGVPLTLGQSMGGLPRAAEGFMELLPFARSVIEGAKQEAVEGFGRAAMNRALKPIGLEVSEGISGVQAFDEAFTAISNQYDEIIPKLMVENADQFAVSMRQGIKEAVEEQPSLWGPELAKFSGTVKNIFDKMPKAGKIEGSVLKDIESKLGREATKAFRGGDYSVSEALKSIQASFRQELAKQDKTGSAALKKVNEAYRDILPIEKAVAKAVSSGKLGQFTPKQLLSSMKQQSPRKAARGLAPEQEFVSSAEQIMGGKAAGSFAAPLTGSLAATEALKGNIRPLATLLASGVFSAPIYSKYGLPATRSLLQYTGGLGQNITPAISGLLAGSRVEE